MQKGEIVKLHTGDGWVPAIVTSDANDDGKFFVTAFAGPAKDDENLQGAASELEVGPGTGKYEVSRL